MNPIKKLEVKEPWLHQIAIGKKQVEGRRGPVEKFTSAVGSVITLYNDTLSIDVRVIKVEHFDDLYQYIDSVGIDKCAPHLGSREKVIEAYHNIGADKGYPYTDENISKAGGMNAIFIELV